MALSKEAAYSLAERKYKRSEVEKAAENFRRWIGRDKSDEKNNSYTRGGGRSIFAEPVLQQRRRKM